MSKCLVELMTGITYHVVAWDVAIELHHRSFGLFMASIAGVIDVRLWDKPDEDDQNLQRG